MPNEQYQSLFGLAGDALREQFLDGAPTASAELVADVPDDELAGAGDRPRRARPRRRCSQAFAAVRRGDRPAERRLRLHRQGLGPADRRQPAQPLGAAHRRADRHAARVASGSTPATEWDRFDPAIAGRAVVRRPARGSWPGRRGRRPRRSTVPATHRAAGRRTPSSTQEAFGRVLVDLARDPRRSRRTS